MIAKKQKIFEEINKVLTMQGKTARNLFQKVDMDKSHDISFEEFKEMFKHMNISEQDHMIREIFRSIDIDDDEKVSWAEFNFDFNKCLTKTVNQMVEEEKLLAQSQGAEDDFEVNKN